MSIVFQNMFTDVKRSNNMKYRCDNCDEYHEIGDLTINIGDEGHKVIDDIANL